MHGTPFVTSLSGQLNENLGMEKIILDAGNDEVNPNAERPPGRKAEKVGRKRSDSDADPFIDELKK
jgi:hypothetical protein